MNSLLRRALAVSRSGAAQPRRTFLGAALLSPPPISSPDSPCRAPVPPPPMRRAFHASTGPLGFRATTPASCPGTVTEAGDGEDGLEVAKLGISPRIVERLAAPGITRLFPIQLDKRTEETKEALYPRKMHTNDSAAKIRVVMKSFNNQKNNLVGLAPYTQKIGLPESRSLYTVLRSPHIDKKSREQFSMHVKKVFVVKKAETHELAKKFFWLKRMRIMGAQYEIHISFKTRLDKKIGCSKGGGLLRQ